MRLGSFLVVVVVGIAANTGAPVASAQLPGVAPADAGFHAEKLAAIEPVLEQAIAEKKMPGCVVCIGRQGKIGWLEAYGNKQVVPTVVPMTVDTLFDMASITKPVATATSIMKLIEQGELKLDDKVASVMPGFEVNDKQDVTIRDLLIHQSGLIADNAMADYADGPEVAMQKIRALKLIHPVGKRFNYSDVNFIVLGEIVRLKSGVSLHEFSRREIFAPLGMTETGFLPNAALRDRAAPTERRDDRWIQGEVHDPRAHKLGGIAGHAGLFSTASDMAIYASMMLAQGAHREARVLKPETVLLMTSDQAISQFPNGQGPKPGIRGLGWDKQTGYSTNKGTRLGKSAFGHGGFTGTVLWIDPERDLFVVFLSNRVHPDGSGSVNQLAGQLIDLVVDSIER